MRIGRVVYRTHSIQRVFERGICADDIRRILEHGVTIEEYPDDYPYASRLVLGWCGDRPVHLVAASNPTANETVVITVYEPDPDRWDSDFKRRKQ